LNDWSILEGELINYRDVSISIQRKLYLYESEIRNQIMMIKALGFDESMAIFDRLFEIQQLLSTAQYKYEFPLSDDLRDFTYYFDRDDIFVRKYWYQKFNLGIEWPCN
jgi:hypothetical protein